MPGQEQPLNCNVQCKTPHSCGEHELAEFARLVRAGFEGSDQGLPGRIRRANRLALYYSSSSELTAIAALKSPHRGEQARQFEIAGIESASDYELELGWVFVDSLYRGRRVARALCEGLLAREPGTGIYATTRPNNEPMKRILSTLGFLQAGKPFPHRRRDEDLILFLRRGGLTALDTQ